MRRIATALAATVFGITLGVAPAFADSPHFLYANNSVSSTTGALTTSFKDAGLGTGTTSVQISLSVQRASAVYQCFNNGGNHPKAGNKETVSRSLDTTGTFSVRNGQTTGSLTVGPPDPGSFTCPNGQTLYLQSVSYAGTYVSDASGSNTFHATPDPIGTGDIHIVVG